MPTGRRSLFFLCACWVLALASFAARAAQSTAQPQATAPAAGKSTKRIKLSTGHQVAAGGNGIGGADETSEDTASTWDTAFTNPTPGALPSGGLVP